MSLKAPTVLFAALIIGCLGFGSLFGQGGTGREKTEAPKKTTKKAPTRKPATSGAQSTQTSTPAEPSDPPTSAPEAVIVPTSTLLARGFEFRDQSAPMCSIRGSGGWCQIKAFVGPESGQDAAAYTCSKLDRASYVGQCIGGVLQGVSLVIADGSTKQARKAFVSYFDEGKIVYPALTSYLEDELNFGVEDASGSQGCVYFGRWNKSDTDDTCRKLGTFYGNDIFAESNARALRNGTFNLSKYSANFKRYIVGQ